MKYLQAHIRGSVDTFMRLKIRQEICASYCTLGKGLVIIIFTLKHTYMHTHAKEIT